MSSLPLGIYERLLDEELIDILETHPDLKTIFRSIDDEISPNMYSRFVSEVLKTVLRGSKPEARIALINRIFELLASVDGMGYLQRKRLLTEKKSVLLQVSTDTQSLTRPTTPLSTSSLLTGQRNDPPLEHELRSEMLTADRVDILVSFVKFSGLRLLKPAFEGLQIREIPVRIISTSYMGASDPKALEWLAQLSNVQIRVSYDTGGTRLHAKAYHFVRNSGFSTAYIGSANMSHSAMTSGLEWTVKATAQDMPHMLDRFVAEFSSYWESKEFEPFTQSEFGRFRLAIDGFRNRGQNQIAFFAEITPRPFQLRILEALQAARDAGKMRNLVVAATGTGKTVVSALDYQRVCANKNPRPRLLFVVHRKEILEQALACFRTILRDQNFGELLVDGHSPVEWQHVFASVQSLNREEPWQRYGAEYFHHVIIDEAHHGVASSYRPLLEHLKPEVLLGLTATPERMDGSSILPDFDGQFVAEIRLPEALEERLLCPFHYFGVSDNIDLGEERFWKNGRYDTKELENIYTGDDLRAKQRINIILQALNNYVDTSATVRCVGFCAGRKHANYMATKFKEAGQNAEVVLGDTQREIRRERLESFRKGEIQYLFTVDVLSEGVDVPDINLVMFLRPTESLTVFLQQLGRGLRHAPGKDCLTVLDFVGQTHRKYRLETKFDALLTRNRQRIDKEIECDFPNLPAGCSIQLERIARERILAKIKTVLQDMKNFIPEAIRTWNVTTEKELTFTNFLQETRLSAIEILSQKTWTEWKSLAGAADLPTDPDLELGRKMLVRTALRTDPELLNNIERLASNLPLLPEKAGFGNVLETVLHYALWGKKASEIGVGDEAGSLLKWKNNSSIMTDALEVAAWRKSVYEYPVRKIALAFECGLKLHAAYGSGEIKAALGLASIHKSGPTGQGVLHSSELRCYVHLVTFNKEERDFSPTTRYRDYAISPTQLHWESQSTTSQESLTGQNHINFVERGYTTLFFARLYKRIDGETAPFIYLGPAKRVLSYENNRPISFVYELEYAMPYDLFELARAA